MITSPKTIEEDLKILEGEVTRAFGIYQLGQRITGFPNIYNREDYLETYFPDLVHLKPMMTENALKKTLREEQEATALILTLLGRPNQAETILAETPSTKDSPFFEPRFKKMLNSIYQDKLVLKALILSGSRFCDAPQDIGRSTEINPAWIGYRLLDWNQTSESKACFGIPAEITYLKKQIH